MKNIKKILLLIICCFLNINFCYAVGVSFNTIDSGEEKVDDDGSENVPIYKSLAFEDDEKYTCHFKYNLTYGMSLMLYGYNQQNVSIIDETVIPSESIKAGTSIGISIVETSSVGWEITDYWVTKKESTTRAFWINVYDNDSCERIDRKTCRIYNYTGVNTECTNQGYSYDSQYNFTCAKDGKKLQTAGSYDETGSGETETNEKKNECYEKAKEHVKNVAKSSEPSESYVVTLNNPNTVDSGAEVSTISSKRSGPTCSGNSCLWKFVYSPGYVCMDKKTAEVRYVDSPSCSETEFYIKNDIIDTVEHFHYFVPLDVVTGEYSLLVNPKSDTTKKSFDKCVKAINDNPINYYDFLFTSTGGIYKAVSKIPSIAKNEVADGCYIRTEIRIPVSSGLYNVDDSNNIKGYNLYVRNVDENNPFPNPVTNQNSLWFDWYESNYDDDGVYKHNTVGPNIKKSFDKREYLLTEVNAGEIRSISSGLGNYLNMNINSDGENIFIREKVSFQEVDNDYYKIGCGPLNESYQEGCGT